MRRSLILALGTLLGAGAALAGGDPEKGRALAGQCRTCHGIDGVAKIPIAPHIGGEPAAYIAAQLGAFRSGAREQEMMSVVARSLSDADIADLAAWYASRRPVVTLKADPAGAPAACVACHGADGLAVAEGVPNLAGETNIYIDTQLKAFRSGKRVHEVMSVVAAGLTDEEMRAAADWYAAIGFTVAPQ